MPELTRAVHLARKFFAREGMGDDNESDDLLDLARELAEEVRARAGDFGRCDDPMCLGWLHMNENGPGQSVQKCDTCKAFPDDPAAIEAHNRECVNGADCKFITGWGKEG